MTNNIITDTSKLSTVPEKNLMKLMSKMIFCINDAIIEAKLNDEKFVDLFIGIGTLSIKLDDEEVSYKFIPSEELEHSVKESIINNNNILVDKLDKSLSDKLINIYKELI